VRLGATGFDVLDDEKLARGDLPRPSIVLASSGMLLPETFSNRLAREVLADPDDAIFLVGYQDPDSPGHQVQRSDVGGAIDLQDGRGPVRRQCDLDRFYFSAHSKRKELLAAAERMKPRRAVICHGDAAAGASLGASFGERGGVVTLPEPGVPYDV
jgi:predicted metal-dependent RNase